MSGFFQEFMDEINGDFDSAIEQIRGSRDDLAQLNDAMACEAIVREAVLEIEASGVLSDVKLSAIKRECGI